MPQLGLGLRANVSGVSLIDGDAAAYFTRAGVTDATAKAQINAFVKGIKELGLWSSIVSWPLRSTQNAGTGTTAYSLGGYGIYDATLNVSPTWGTNGITFNGSNYLSLSNVIATSRINKLAMAIGSITGYGANRFFDVQDTGSNTRRNPFLFIGAYAVFDCGFGLPNSGVSSPEALSFVSNLPQNTFYSVIGRTTSGSMFVYRDKVLKASLGGQTFNQGSTYSYSRMGSEYTGTISFTALGGEDISEAQLNSLNDLYKTTLGTGLGLS
jgi:hypothetical protein